MRKHEKQPNGSDRTREINVRGPDWAGGEFHGEAPPDRSGPLNEEIVGTLGSLFPPPSGLEQAEPPPKPAPPPLP